jgi:O-antigen/teichoic acid export membrane protein
MGCVTLVYLTLGGNILEAWLGAKFDQKSKYILQIISLGLIPYAVASISTSLIHSHGSSNLTTIVNMAMFMPAIAGIYVLVKYFGPVGAAAAWTIRILIEAICFYAIARWKISKLKNVAPC